MKNTDTITLDAVKAVVAERLAELAHGHAAAREPEGNPLPLAMMDTWEGGFAFIMIDPAYMRSAETKENLIVFLRKFIRQHRAQCVCLMSPVWRALAKTRPAGESKEEMMAAGAAARRGLPANLADAPGVEEYIMLWHATQFVREIWSAPLIRHEDGPPTLGAWSLGFGGAEVAHDRFSERLQQSIIAVA